MSMASTQATLTHLAPPLPPLLPPQPEREPFNRVRSRTCDSHQIKRIHDSTRAVVRLAATGLKPFEIADLLGLEASYVGRLLGSDIVQDQLEALRNGQDDRVLAARRKLNAAACDLVEGLLIDAGTSKSVKDRSQIRQDLLDRIGIAKVTRTESTNVEKKHTTIEHIKRIAASAPINPNIPPLEVLFTASAPGEGGVEKPRSGDVGMAAMNDSNGSSNGSELGTNGVLTESTVGEPRSGDLRPDSSSVSSNADPNDSESESDSESGDDSPDAIDLTDDDINDALDLLTGLDDL